MLKSLKSAREAMAEAQKILARDAEAIVRVEKEIETASRQFEILVAKRGGDVADAILAGTEARTIAEAMSQEHALRGRLTALRAAKHELERRSLAQLEQIPLARDRVIMALREEVRGRMADLDGRISRAVDQLRPIVADAMQLHAAALHTGIAGIDWLQHAPDSILNQKLEMPPAHDGLSIPDARWVPLDLRETISALIELGAAEKRLATRAGEIAQREREVRRNTLPAEDPNVLRDESGHAIRPGPGQTGYVPPPGAAEQYARDRAEAFRLFKGETPSENQARRFAEAEAEKARG